MSSSGIRAERDLVHRFWDAGFAVLRAPASGGGIILPRPDLIVGSKSHNKFFVIEVKTVRKDSLYIDSNQIEGLLEFANRIGFKPILAVKFKNHKKDYVFLDVPDQLLKVRNGTNFKVAYLHALNVGLKFSELIGEYQQMKLV